MKTMKTLINTVAKHYDVSADDVRHDLRAYFDHLMEDPDFRSAWEEIPKADDVSEEEWLLVMMIANPPTDHCR